MAASLSNRTGLREGDASRELIYFSLHTNHGYRLNRPGDALGSTLMPGMFTRENPEVDRYVLFLDVMGFGDLVLDHPHMLGTLHPLEPGARARRFDISARLVFLLSAFYDVLKQYVEGLSDDTASVIIFSDSAFVKFTKCETACQDAMRLMRSFLAKRVPVRMGLAGGTFDTLRFTLDHTQRSDVHVSQFVGTGVVRASWAESKSRVSGFRIILHPSLKPVITSDVIGRFVLPLEENQYACAELAYLETYASKGVLPDSFVDMDQVDQRNLDLVKSIAWLRSVSKPQFHFQHDATLEALERMRIALDLRDWPSPSKAEAEH